MLTNRKLPENFLRLLASLEQSYLQETDPIRQSGFSGGPVRWRSERGPILEAITGDGDLLDVGCANGYLLECLLDWAQERRIDLVPYGIDQGAKLIDLARKRFPGLEEHFFVGNAWDWQPPQQFQYVYTLYDCVPLDYLAEYVHRLLLRVVHPDGRLIVGAYGSRSDRTPPFDVGGFLESKGFSVLGRATGGEPAITCFAWLDRSAHLP